MVEIEIKPRTKVEAPQEVGESRDARRPYAAPEVTSLEFVSVIKASQGSLGDGLGLHETGPRG